MKMESTTENGDESRRTCGSVRRLGRCVRNNTISWMICQPIAVALLFVAHQQGWQDYARLVAWVSGVMLGWIAGLVGSYIVVKYGVTPTSEMTDA